MRYKTRSHNKAIMYRGMNNNSLNVCLRSLNEKIGGEYTQAG